MIRNGGAVAVWASSSLTEPEPQAAMNGALYRLLFGDSAQTVGDALVGAKLAVGDADVRRSWVFFGDPAMRLKGLPLAGGSPSPTVTVPDVLYLTQFAADTALALAGLATGTLSSAHSQTVAAGAVIGQSPAAGTTVARGSAVALVISTGPAPLPGVSERLLIGLGPLAGDGGWIAARGGIGEAGETQWARLAWPAYNAAGGGVRVATGDVDGDGLDEVVVGLGPGSNGWIAVHDDAAHGFALLKWIQVRWPSYNAANGEVFPAVGDLDNDGRDEIVAGLGTGGAGWFQVIDDGVAGYTHLAWKQVPWSEYAAGNGATHPAIANVDGVGASEIVVGLGPGGAGWLAIHEGAANAYNLRRWVQVEWPTYNAAHGATFPAAGDLDDDGRAEIVVGLGNRGGGWLAVLDDGPGGFRLLQWLRTSWAAYNQSGSGETHPAIGNLDGDGADEIIVGLDTFAGEGGWLESFDDTGAGTGSLGWQNVDRAGFRSSGGSTFPAVGRLR